MRPNHGEGALDDPAARRHDEAGHVIAPLDDLDPEVGDLGAGLIDLAGVVAAVGPDQFEPWEARVTRSAQVRKAAPAVS